MFLFLFSPGGGEEDHAKCNDHISVFVGLYYKLMAVLKTTNHIQIKICNRSYKKKLDGGFSKFHNGAEMCVFIQSISKYIL